MMNRVYQNRFGEDDGNCFQAVVASLFELPIEEVPDFTATRSMWWARFDEWCIEHYGLQPLQIDIRRDYWYTPDGYYLIDGKSPRGDFLHQCIGLDGQVIHDPHPSGAGLEDYQHIIVFVKHFPLT